MTTTPERNKRRTIVADGEFVIVHGRFSGFLPVNWIAGDIPRIKDGAPMFGTSVPT
jgi:hypothetical protein